MSYVNEFGQLTAECIIYKNPAVGMKEAGIIKILGKPQSVNETQTANGVSNQYVYSNMYIYTVNGVVTAIQSSKK